MNAWLALIIAGCFEVGFAVCMKLSNGFSNWVYSLGFFFFATSSFALLAYATKTIPMGTAYIVWTGIGAVGTATIGMLLFKDPVSITRIALMGVLLAALIGLKITSPDQH